MFCTFGIDFQWRIIMSKDKDLERIKNGEGLKNSNTSSSHSSGTTTEQRGSGVRVDQYTLNDEKKKGN